MATTGPLRKMFTTLGEPIAYVGRFGDDKVDMNALIGRDITLTYQQEILCVACGRQTRKSFGQGFCYPCFRDSPMNAECIIRPELCEGHEGGGRDPEWEEAHHVQPHTVYLALSSVLKVGVTRATQVPTRWIDQGASAAIRVADVPYRQLAGLIEVALKDHLTDRTNWQRMLKGQVLADVDLLAEKNRVLELLPKGLRKFRAESDDVTVLRYPVATPPKKVKSLSFDSTTEVAGLLAGIKGQYLIFDDGRVLNVRKHSGYVVSLDHAAAQPSARQPTLPGLSAP